MSVWTSIRDWFFGGASDNRVSGAGTRTEWYEVEPQRRYALLWSYYHQNDLYLNALASLWEREQWSESLRGLRNPTYRVVEFYVSTVWPGELPDAMPITTENGAIEPLIAKVWTWSNWGPKRQLAMRHLALLGDMFLQVRAYGAELEPAERRVSIAVVNPMDVTDFEVDERGIVTMFRTDVRIEISDTQIRTRTQVWDLLGWRQWTHQKPPGTKLAELGPPQEEATLEEFGLDFLPFVHATLKDVGSDRGQGAIDHALDKIDEANRIVTRLHQTLFRYNKPTWALSSVGNDPSGRPLPPPRLPGATESATDSRLTRRDALDDEMFRLPGNSKLEAMVPSIDYEGARKIVADQVGELEKDLPELAYYRVREMGDLSGRAVRLLLSDAVAKVLEARGNAQAALVRAQQMALTLGQVHEIPGFEESAIGTYDSGSFDHTFDERDVIEMSGLEKAETEKAEGDAAVARQAAGVSQHQTLLEMGYDEDEIAKMRAENDEEQEDAAARIAQQFSRGNIGGGDGGQFGGDNQDGDGGQ